MTTLGHGGRPTGTGCHPLRLGMFATMKHSISVSGDDKAGIHERIRLSFFRLKNNRRYGPHYWPFGGHRDVLGDAQLRGLAKATNRRRGVPETDGLFRTGH